jgi:hypothetical protein
MTTRHTKLLIGAMACFVLSIPATAQNPGQAAPDPCQTAPNPCKVTGQRPTQAAYQLRALGIDLSEHSLVAALGNSEPKIRVLAALQLGQDHASDAIPSIEYALSVEKDVKARIGIAVALGSSSFHDPKGVEHLQAMCKDTALPIADVIDVVQSIQMNAGASSAGCADVILDSLNRAQDAEYRYIIVTLLPTMYRELPPEQSGRIVSKLQEFLIDNAQQPAVRLGASHALANIGLPASVEFIRNAMLREGDPQMRSDFQSDLNSLEAKR